VASAIVLTLAALVVNGWVTTSRAAADNITVKWAGPPVCTGTTVDASHGTPIVKAVKDMRCVVHVVVHNGSGHSARLDDAHAAYMGPDAMTVVRAAPSALLAGSLNYGIDARYALRQEVLAGQKQTFEIGLEFRPSGCDEGTVTIYDFPIVDLKILGRSHHVAADQNFSYRREGATRGCRES